MGKKSSCVTKRGLWQNQAQGSSAICCNWLKHEGKETRKHNHHELARTNACTILTSAKMAEICSIRHHVNIVVQRKLQNEDSNLTHQTFSFSAASPSVISISYRACVKMGYAYETATTSASQWSIITFFQMFLKSDEFSKAFSSS